jgi:hypothetical protein
MDEPYRSWDERRKIIRSIIAETNTEPLNSFQLTDSEGVYLPRQGGEGGR